MRPPGNSPVHDWNQIIDQFGPVVWRQALRMLGDASDAADCFQTVMLEAFELSQRQGVSSWPGLLRRLAILRSLDALRARYRNRRDPRPVDEIGVPADGKRDALASVERQELAERLRMALARLPRSQAEAFSLRWIDGLSNQEVARRMQITANHVGVLLHRARRALRGLLSHDEVA